MTQTSFAYCNLNFYDQATQASFSGVDTGVIGETKGTIPPLDLSDGMVLVYQEVPDNLYPSDSSNALIANSERCYISKTGVGPSYRIILPAFTCVVAKPSLLPSPPAVSVPEVVITQPPPEWGIPSSKNNYGLNIVLGLESS
jgi:hypothetical protein